MANTNPLHELLNAGQSVWLDFIQRSLLDGELQRLISEDHVRGLTSNPAIFEQAISKTDEYDEAIARILADEPEIETLELYNRLAIADIQAAADAFRNVYEQSAGQDGMVSLEVTPDLAHDAVGTVRMGLDLWQRVDRPNLMIKVPGTRAGVDAFRELSEQGVNVNVTLLFSVSRYLDIARAWIAALEKRGASGQDIDRLASVASFFVSRVDSAVDAALDELGTDAAQALKGQIAIANAKVAYGHFVNLYGSDAFAQIKQHGAHPQRLLWASTGTKNADYSDVLYVEQLIGADTVNTVPPKTLDAFRDHGSVAATLTRQLPEAHQQLEQLKALGISLDTITERLEQEGIQSFVDAFNRLIAALDERRQTLLAQTN